MPVKIMFIAYPPTLLTPLNALHCKHEHCIGTCVYCKSQTLTKILSRYRLIVTEYCLVKLVDELRCESS